MLPLGIRLVVCEVNFLQNKSVWQEVNAWRHICTYSNIGSIYNPLMQSHIDAWQKFAAFCLVSCLTFSTYVTESEINRISVACNIAHTPPVHATLKLHPLQRVACLQLSFFCFMFCLFLFLVKYSFLLRFWFFPFCHCHTSMCSK